MSISFNFFLEKNPKLCAFFLESHLLSYTNIIFMFKIPLLQFISKSILKGVPNNPDSIIQWNMVSTFT